MSNQKIYTCFAVILAFLVGSAASYAQDEQSLDVLERSKASGKLVACADPYDFPYAAQNTNPPGFDVEILQELAKLGGMQLEMYWADTGTRGGMSRALRNSMMKGRCDIFAGVADNGEDDILMGKLGFSNAYLGLGYILVVQNKAKDMKTIEEIAAAKLTIGVPMSTPIDAWLFDHGIAREIYPDNPRIMRGMANGEVDAALVWATVLTTAKKKIVVAANSVRLRDRRSRYMLTGGPPAWAMKLVKPAVPPPTIPKAVGKSVSADAAPTRRLHQ